MLINEELKDSIKLHFKKDPRVQHGQCYIMGTLCCNTLVYLMFAKTWVLKKLINKSIKKIFIYKFFKFAGAYCLFFVVVFWGGDFFTIEPFYVLLQKRLSWSSISLSCFKNAVLYNG